MRLKLYNLRGELFRRGIKAPDARELLRKKVDDVPQKWVLVEDDIQTQENESSGTNGVLTIAGDQGTLHLHDGGNVEDDSSWEDEIEDRDTFSGGPLDTVTFESEVRDEGVFSEASQDTAVLENEMQDLDIS